MTPYVFDVLSQEDIALFYKIKHIIENLPDIDLGFDENGEKIMLSCHILTIAVANVFPDNVKRVSGLLYPNFEHSWLVTYNGNIIDVYPVATLGGPLLIKGESFSLTDWHYIERPVYDMNSSQQSLKRSIRKVINLLKAQL